MGRKKKRRGKGAPAGGEPKHPQAPERIARPFAEALRDVRLPGPKDRVKAAPTPAPARRAELVDPERRERPAGSEPPEEPRYSWEDRVAMSQAYRDVRPLRDPRGRAGVPAPRREVPAPPPDGPDEDAWARQRLAALVTGGLRFEVHRDEDGRIQGARAGAPPEALRDLRSGRARPEAEIDLHGLRAKEAEAELVRFVRAHYRRGARVVRVVHGKGLHSEAGAVLRDRVLAVLTEGGAAPFVRAFVTAAPDGGGTGALLVRLGA